MVIFYVESCHFYQIALFWIHCLRMWINMNFRVIIGVVCLLAVLVILGSLFFCFRRRRSSKSMIPSSSSSNGSGNQKKSPVEKKIEPISEIPKKGSTCTLKSSQRRSQRRSQRTQSSTPPVNSLKKENAPSQSQRKEQKTQKSASVVVSKVNTVKTKRNTIDQTKTLARPKKGYNQKIIDMQEEALDNLDNSVTLAATQTFKTIEQF
ncbi:unnamed protein product [Caenorhabditis auriculariae]|uniref:Uncharacterized protein n=1 Tax=Caenorhabditis auriculariae TaxID=2777116 RepID=A0A8S1HRH6_9PELO|nr:unnamed protein product [Caenorhabditis auriculariae]